ncbi:single-stranded DNA-binding protein B [Robertmurraya siralis]|uniref:Single-stranded DNA-binding protein n=1 Tax=Robertmurraya siralis TaxID=77777 RepID=A0A919WJ61_9BACI|nr:single-stranded DNA-binding protein [Robertmurraya siralis]PAE19594.1 single-stranded DNA-binding protein [Bacillus sp. 7504-2]GIN63011.1 single-stranded DNA-binding protein B [Robertmurraya siralis]
MINQVTLVGRLTKDPELRVTTEGNSVVNIILAVNRNYRNQKGEIDADFVQCTIWRKNAENLSLYCKKGTLIGLMGRIQTRTYESEDGRKYVTEVIAESVRFLEGKRNQVANVEKEVLQT